jgi:hypothetical protein
MVGDGAYYEKRMNEYMKSFDHTKSAKFIGPPKVKEYYPNYGNRLKVEETFHGNNPTNYWLCKKRSIGYTIPLFALLSENKVTCA